MRAGTPLTHLVEFSSGLPDGDLEWELLDAAGDVVTSGTITPAVDAVSVVIALTGVDNAIEGGVLASPRELSWSYLVDGLLVKGAMRYRLEVFLPFGVSPEGVRRKLGVESHELVDADIDLVLAYGAFRDTVGEAELTAAAAAGGHPALLICEAIEAAAALAVLPALQVSLAQRESSGTNQFHRARIDWERLEAYLLGLVNDGYATVSPTLDFTTAYTSLLVLVSMNDPVTGADV